MARLSSGMIERLLRWKGHALEPEPTMSPEKAAYILARPDLDWTDEARREARLHSVPAHDLPWWCGAHMLRGDVE